MVDRVFRNGMINLRINGIRLVNFVATYLVKNIKCPNEVTVWILF